MEINPHFMAHLYYEQHPESREAQLMRCMATLEQIAKSEDRLKNDGDFEKWCKIISRLESKYNKQVSELKRFELFGNLEQLEK
jgi:hypothetical protein